MLLFSPGFQLNHASLRLYDLKTRIEQYRFELCCESFLIHSFKLSEALIADVARSRL